MERRGDLWVWITPLVIFWDLVSVLVVLGVFTDASS